MAITIYNLAQVEIQKIYHYLNFKSLLFMARCCKQLYNDANSKISLKYLPRLNILSTINVNTISPLIINHPELFFTGEYSQFNKTLKGIHNHIKYLHIDFDYYVDSILVDIGSIAALVRHNTILTQLSIRSNNLGKADGIIIADALKVNNKLISLDLHGNYIGVSGSTAIIEAIRINSTIALLNIGKNIIIGDDDNILNYITAIASLINDNKTLASLYIYANSISNIGAISEAIKVNNTLTFLDLCYNEIDDTGGVAIAEALKVNCTLTYLDLSSNDISEVGGVALAESIKINCKLTKLILSNNDISEVGGVALAEALNFNYILVTLNIEGNYNTLATRTSITTAIERNIRLTFL